MDLTVLLSWIESLPELPRLDDVRIALTTASTPQSFREAMQARLGDQYDRVKVAFYRERCGDCARQRCGGRGARRLRSSSTRPPRR